MIIGEQGTDWGRKPSPVCSNYRLTKSIDVCQCGVRWEDHTIAVRDAFLAAATSEERQLLDLRLLPRPDRCSEFRPVVIGIHKICQCGAFYWEHHITVQVNYSRKEAETIAKRVEPHPCSYFMPRDTTRGICQCGFSWLSHVGPSRGRYFEELPDIDHGAHCQFKTGKCLCVSDPRKQEILEMNRGCKKFTMKAAGNTICACGLRFHEHRKDLRGGFDDFILWRQANMTNAEIFSWWEHLARTTEDRTARLKRIIDNPSLYLPFDAPSIEVVKFLYELSPKPPKPRLVLPAGAARLCNFCSKDLKANETYVCHACIDNMNNKRESTTSTSPCAACGLPVLSLTGIVRTNEGTFHGDCWKQKTQPAPDACVDCGKPVASADNMVIRDVHGLHHENCWTARQVHRPTVPVTTHFTRHTGTSRTAFSQFNTDLSPDVTGMESD